MSGGGHGRRRGKHEEHEEHVNHERWLVSYADMMTVLMALFIVLFAISKVDPVKATQIKDGFTDGTTATNVVLPGNAGINEVDNGAEVIDLKPLAGGNPMDPGNDAQEVLDQAQKEASQADLDAASKEVADYRSVEQAINTALVAKGDQNQVTYRITSEGLVVGLVADNVFFENASAEIEPKGLEVLDAVGPILAGLPNQIDIQGHTNALPLRGSAIYRSNWDLSSARANSVLMHFVDVSRISDQRVEATGLGAARPLYPDSDPRALAGNRRVDLVIASASKESVKALLPQVAAVTPSTGPVELDPDPAGVAAAGIAPAQPAATPETTTAGTTTAETTTAGTTTTEHAATEAAGSTAHAGTTTEAAGETTTATGGH